MLDMLSHQEEKFAIVQRERVFSLHTTAIETLRPSNKTKQGRMIQPLLDSRSFCPQKPRHTVKTNFSCGLVYVMLQKINARCQIFEALLN